MKTETPSRPAHWPFPELTPRQQSQRAAFELRMREGTLRGLPSVFGDLR